MLIASNTTVAAFSCKDSDSPFFVFKSNNDNISYVKYVLIAFACMDDVKKARHPNQEWGRDTARGPRFMTSDLDLIPFPVLGSFLWHKGPMAKHPNRRFGFVTLFLVHKDKNPVTFLKN